MRERRASNRLATPLSVKTSQAWGVPENPLSCCGPRSRSSNKPANLAASRVSDDDAIWAGERLQPRRKIGRLANDRLFLGGTRADQIADHDKPGGDTEPHLQSLGQIETLDGVNDR